MIDWHELSDETKAKIREVQGEIGVLMQRWAELRLTDDEDVAAPIVVAWAGAMEITSIELEREEAGLRVAIAKEGQHLSTSAGLALTLRNAFD